MAHPELDSQTVVAHAESEGLYPKQGVGELSLQPFDASQLEAHQPEIEMAERLPDNAHDAEPTITTGVLTSMANWAKRTRAGRTTTALLSAGSGIGGGAVIVAPAFGQQEVSSAGIAGLRAQGASAPLPDLIGMYRARLANVPQATPDAQPPWFVSNALVNCRDGMLSVKKVAVDVDDHDPRKVKVTIYRTAQGYSEKIADGPAAYFNVACDAAVNTLVKAELRTPASRSGSQKGVLDGTKKLPGSKASKAFPYHADYYVDDMASSRPGNTQPSTWVDTVNLRTTRLTRQQLRAGKLVVGIYTDGKAQRSEYRTMHGTRPDTTPYRVASVAMFRSVRSTAPRTMRRHNRVISIEPWARRR